MGMGLKHVDDGLTWRMEDLGHIKSNLVYV